MYFDWIKYFIYNTNKCTLDTYKYSAISLLRVSESLLIIILQAYCNIIWIIFVICCIVVSFKPWYGAP